MLVLILKTIIEALESPFNEAFFDILSQKSYKGPKFLIKILFIILFEKIDFEDFDIKRHSGEEKFYSKSRGKAIEDDSENAEECKQSERGIDQEKKRKEGGMGTIEGIGTVTIEEGRKRGKEKCVEKFLEVHNLYFYSYRYFFV
jgi:hypothetical protein